jgi:hypothetical protein
MPLLNQPRVQDDLRQIEFCCTKPASCNFSSLQIIGTKSAGGVFAQCLPPGMERQSPAARLQTVTTGALKSSYDPRLRTLAHSDSVLSIVSRIPKSSALIFPTFAALLESECHSSEVPYLFSVRPRIVVKEESRVRTLGSECT